MFMMTGLIAGCGFLDNGAQKELISLKAEYENYKVECKKEHLELKTKYEDLKSKNENLNKQLKTNSKNINALSRYEVLSKAHEYLDKVEQLELKNLELNELKKKNDILDVIKDLFGDALYTSSNMSSSTKKKPFLSKDI